MPAVSFIIPLYNAAATMERTIGSVLAQKMKDFEVLLVDDGSSDETLAAARKMADADPRIRVFCHAQNAGVAAARNTGLENAAGEFIRFVDADDFIPPHSTGGMVRIARKRDADMVMGVMRRQSAVHAYNYARTIRAAEKKVLDRYDEDLIYSFSLCNKLFRRSVIEAHQIRFQPYRHAEDGLFLYDFLQYTNRLRGYTGIAYVYNKPEFFEAPSTTQNLTAGMLEEILEIAEKILSMHPAAPASFQDAFRARILGITLINEYYRKIWRLEPEALALLLEQAGVYWDLLPERQRREVLQTNKDLPAPDQLGGKEDLCQDPLFTVLIGEHVSDAHLPLLLESLYYQKVPAFAVRLHPSKAGKIPEIYLTRENLTVAETEADFRSPCSGCSICLERDVFFTYETLSRAYTALQKNSCIRGTLLECGEKGLKKAAVRSGEKDLLFYRNGAADAGAKPVDHPAVKLVLADSAAERGGGTAGLTKKDNLFFGQLRVYGSVLKHRLRRERTAGKG